MPSGVFSRKWILFYFQFFGIYSVNAERSLTLTYQIVLLVALFGCFSRVIHEQITFEFIGVFRIVSMLESKLQHECHQERSLMAVNSRFLIAWLYVFAAASSVYSAIKYHQLKIEIYLDLKAFDDAFDLKLNPQQKRNPLSINYSTLLWVIAFISNGSFLLHQFSNSFLFFSYILPTALCYHVIYMTIIQVIFFAQGIQFRTKMISRELQSFRESFIPTNREENLEELFLIKTLFVHLHDANKKINHCFKTPLLICLLQLNTTRTISFYWMGLALLGWPNAFIFGELLKLLN